MTTTLAANITNQDARPPAINDSKLDGGILRCIMDTIEVPDTADNDVCILARVPVDACLVGVELATDDCGSAGTADLGYFKRNSDLTYTAVDANNLASGLDINTAAVAFTQRRFSAANIDTVRQKVWELAGLSARPAYDYLYIGLTTTTGTTTIGTASIKVFYTI